MIASNNLVPFRSFWNHEIFVELNLPIFPVLVRSREKSQKYFDLLAVKQILILSSPSCTIDAMNFKMWEFCQSFSFQFVHAKSLENP